ncbi:hypothetical protein [Mycoplasma sp. P36-A1]|uniref:hypothetical protein n=1 Tax=Mycoplasma sp. P36-A1 TaxID=3252900 RepID=UPI003C2CCC6D
MNAKSSMVNLLGKLNRVDKSYQDYLIVINTASGIYKAEFAYFFDDVIADIRYNNNKEFDVDVSLVEKVFKHADSVEVNDIFENNYNQDVVILQNVEHTSGLDYVAFHRQLLMFIDQIITITLEKKTIIA